MVTGTEWNACSILGRHLELCNCLSSSDAALRACKRLPRHFILRDKAATTLACLPGIAKPINASVSSAEAYHMHREKLRRPDFLYENRILVFLQHQPAFDTGLAGASSYATPARALLSRRKPQRVLFTPYSSNLSLLVALN